jgi:hypothetical protein
MKNVKNYEDSSCVEIMGDFSSIVRKSILAMTGIIFFE